MFITIAIPSCSYYSITIWFPSYIKHLNAKQNVTVLNSTESEDRSLLYTETFIYAASSVPGTILTAIVVDLPYMSRALWLCELLVSSEHRQFPKLL